MRRIIPFITLLIIASIATITILYAKGYRISTENGELTPNGHLVIKSDPDGAQVFINNELTTVTNDNMTLPPGEYNITVKKEGYMDWNKKLAIEKETVTEETAHLFKAAPSLSAITFNSVISPIPSSDFSKLAYIIPNQNTLADESKIIEDEDKTGIWVLETINLPLGFSRDPRRITDLYLEDAIYTWAPNGREILISGEFVDYLIPTNDFTPKTSLVNIHLQKQATLGEWKEEEETKKLAQIKNLPDEVQNLLKQDVTHFEVSPDEDMILYTASSSATLSKGLIPELPGSSTQKEERKIVEGKTYVYSVKEDRNFLVDEGNDLTISGGTQIKSGRLMTWFPTSRHLLLTEENKVVIMDNDGTNRKDVYTGGYLLPNAYPTLSTDRIIILTNFGAIDAPYNLYSVSVK